MQWQTKVSDTDFVEGIRLFNRRRRRFHAVMMFVIAATAVGLMIYFRRIIEGGPSIPDEGLPWFEVGVGVGLVVGQSIFWALFGFGYSIGLYFGGRKDRLLVSYHDRLIELGELDSQSSL